MLQDKQLVPGIEGDDRLQHYRQVFGLAQHAAPLVQPRILVPVEIIDESAWFTGVSSPGPLCLFDLGFRSGEQRIDGTEIDTGEVDAIIIVAPLPSPYGSTICTDSTLRRLPPSRIGNCCPGNDLAVEASIMKARPITSPFRAK
ncbi:hypothetical protein AT6N2_C2971 [Agrobacterium tumefaciens]|nr:hypothetical protein AT6N2_C2971 [Agrobacterium tumefaciens]